MEAKAHHEDCGKESAPAPVNFLSQHIIYGLVGMKNLCLSNRLRLVAVCVRAILL